MPYVSRIFRSQMRLSLSLSLCVWVCVCVRVYVHKQVNLELHTDASLTQIEELAIIPWHLRFKVTTVSTLLLSQ